MARIKLDEYEAAAAEETLEPHVIEFMGEEFVIPNEREWDVDLVGPIARRNLDLLFANLLGTEQWDKLRQLGRKTERGHLTMGHLEFIMLQIAQAQGLESLGEYQDGGDSPPTTGGPLSPTSNGSTGFGSAGRSRQPRPAAPAPRAAASGTKRSRASGRGKAAKPASPPGG